MINFYELEKRCKKLQQKRLKKRILIVLLLVVVVAIISWLFINQTTKHQEKKEVKKEHKKVIKTEKIEKTEKTEKKIKEEKSEKVEKIKKIEKPKQIKKEENKTINKTIKQEIPIISYTLNLNNIKEVNLSTKQLLKGKENNKKENNKTVIKEEKNSNSIKTKNLTFDEALNSANLYYQNGNYKETIKWCKIASSLNNENEEVWKLYSLSLERLGNREKAIKVLKTYLKYKNSTELKLILERLEK